MWHPNSSKQLEHLIFFICEQKFKHIPWIFLKKCRNYANVWLIQKINLGTIHLRRRHFVGGRGQNLPTDSSKKNCRREGIVVKNHKNLPTSWMDGSLHEIKLVKFQHCADWSPPTKMMISYFLQTQSNYRNVYNSSSSTRKKKTVVFSLLESNRKHNQFRKICEIVVRFISTTGAFCWTGNGNYSNVYNSSSSTRKKKTVVFWRRS